MRAPHNLLMANAHWLPIPLKMALAQLRDLLRSRRTRWLLRRATNRGEIRLIVGSGHTRYEGWIPTNIDTLNLLDESTWARFLRPGTVTAILAEHVWEHLTPEEGLIAAQTCFRFLRPGGHLRVAVPDGLHPDARYIAEVKPPADGHAVLYTHESLTTLLEAAGLSVQLYEYYDAIGVLHSDPWDPSGGTILRSKQYNDAHPDLPFNPVDTSIILDAIRPPAGPRV